VTDTNARLKERLDRIRFRAWRRGFREADMVLGPFADRVGPELTDAELTEFESLLAEDNDHVLYSWIIETAPTPPEHDTLLLGKLRAFVKEHVAHAVQQGIG
jgi:antitoxin CptB